MFQHLYAGTFAIKDSKTEKTVISMQATTRCCVSPFIWIAACPFLQSLVSIQLRQ